jgi:hypothetical protein
MYCISYCDLSFFVSCFYTHSLYLHILNVYSRLYFNYFNICNINFKYIKIHYTYRYILTRNESILNIWLFIHHFRFLFTFQTLLVTWCTNSLTFNNCTFCPHCIYVFWIFLRTNSDLCHLQLKLIGFYNRDEKCLLRGTNWVFK